jgi:hypothetical protein
MTTSELFADLGIPSDYGRQPRRPQFVEATNLVDVEHNIVGTMQQLTPDRIRPRHGTR